MHFIRLLLPVIFLLGIMPIAQAAEPLPPDVRIVIDISGSMKQTDPQNLRRPALNLLTELLPADAQSGVWTFGRYVDMSVAHGEVNDAWRAAARNASGRIGSVALNTNLTGALDRAMRDAPADPEYAQSVILLTDGRIDMDDTEGDPTSPANRLERQRLLSQILPAYREAGVKIHTLALSDNADKETLQQIAMETDGLFLQARTADELMPAFLKAFDRSVPVEQVPMDGNRFNIDNSVREFTALIFRSQDSQPTVLVAPDGTRYDAKSAELQGGVRWHHDLNFDLVTISSPQAGEWFADAKLDPDNRVQILSDLRLRVDGLPGSLFSGVPVELEMSLTNEGDTVTEPTILQLTDVTLQVTAPDGRTGSKLLSDPEDLPEDGIFRETLSRLSQPGEYQIEVIARGRTFERRSQLTATLAEPMSVTTTPVPEEQKVQISVKAESDLVDRTLSRVMARITSPDGGSLIRSMPFSQEEQAWTLDLRPEKGDGKYEVMLVIRGVSASGMTFKSKPESMLINFPLSTEMPHSEPVLNSLLDEPLQGDLPEEMPEETPAQETEPEETDDEQAAPPIVPDLAQKFAEQQSQPPAAVAESSTESDGQVEDETGSDTEEDTGGLPWWVYLILGLVNLGIISGGVWWWLRRRNKTTEPDIDDLLDDEDGDMTPGDFDLFDNDDEEDIPVPDVGPDLDSDLDSDISATAADETQIPELTEDAADLSVTQAEALSENQSEADTAADRPEPVPQPAPDLSEAKEADDLAGFDDIDESEPAAETPPSATADVDDDPFADDDFDDPVPVSEPESPEPVAVEDDPEDEATDDSVDEPEDEPESEPEESDSEDDDDDDSDFDDDWGEFDLPDDDSKK